MGFRGLAFDISSSRLSEYDEDGFLQVQVQPFGGDDAQTQPFELHSPFGFLSRPDDPDPAGLGCTVLFSVAGDDTNVWLGSDPRYIPLVPPLKKGGSCMYCKTGAFSVFDGETGGYTIYVPYANGQKSMVVSIDPKDESIVVAHGDGAALQLTKDGAALKNKSGSAYISITEDGISLVGPVHVAGAMNAGPTMLAYLGVLAANTKPPSPPPLPTLSLT